MKKAHSGTRPASCSPEPGSNLLCGTRTCTRRQPEAGRLRSAQVANIESRHSEGVGQLQSTWSLEQEIASVYGRPLFREFY